MKIITILIITIVFIGIITGSFIYLSYNKVEQNLMNDTASIKVHTPNQSTLKNNSQSLQVQEDDKEFLLNPFKINCPDDCKLVDGAYIPYITNTIPTKNISKFLENSIIIGEAKRDDWYNNSIMENKVKELTDSLNSDYEKAKTIINWARKSKNYCDENTNNCISIMNYHLGKDSNKEYSYDEFFNYDYGVCLDSAYLTTTMLRKAGIPSAYRVLPDNFHATIMFYVNGKWYATDPTFCFDKNNCDDRNIIEIGMERNSIFYYDSEPSFRHTNGKYCDMSNLCYDVKLGGTQKFIFVNEELGEIFIPNSNILNGLSKQYGCGLNGYCFACDSYGCFFDKECEKNENILGRDIVGTSNIFYVNNIPVDTFGYVYSRLPLNNKYKYICQGIYDTSPIASAEISLKRGEITIITPDTLKLENGADIKEYNEIKSLLSKGIEGIDIQKIIEENKN